jgi:uncharacterized protein YndB with AHSA1/START domain
MTETHREVGRRRIASGEEVRTVLIRRRYDAPVEDVWEACTEPERLSRWFLPVSGDLRVGGRFSLQGNAGGEILRCEPPRLLTVTWVYGDLPADEVELRLSDGGDGATVLELEHALAARTLELDGRLLDRFLNDPQTGLWGVPTGWEMPLVHALPRYLRGELPDAPAVEWYRPTPEDLELGERCGREWAAVVQAADRSG